MNIDFNKVADLQEMTMYDVCTIDVFSSTPSGPYNEPLPIWTPGADQKCAFIYSGGSKIYRNGMVLESEIASIRLPASVSITKLDHITLKSKNGFVLTNPITFGIESIQPGVGELIVKLRNVEA